MEVDAIQQEKKSYFGDMHENEQWVKIEKDFTKNGK